MGSDWKRNGKYRFCMYKIPWQHFWEDRQRWNRPQASWDHLRKIDFQSPRATSKCVAETPIVWPQHCLQKRFNHVPRWYTFACSSQRRTFKIRIAILRGYEYQHSHFPSENVRVSICNKLWRNPFKIIIHYRPWKLAYKIPKCFFVASALSSISRWTYCWWRNCDERHKNIVPTSLQRFFLSTN